MNSLRFIALLCTVSVLFVAGCQKKAPTPPATIPTPPANVQPAPEAPTPAPQADQPTPPANTPPAANGTGNNNTFPRPAGNRTINGILIAKTNNTITVSYVDTERVLTGDNAPLPVEQFNKLSESEKKAHSDKIRALIQSAPKTENTFQVNDKTLFSLRLIIMQADPTQQPNRQTSEISFENIVENSPVLIGFDANSDIALNVITTQIIPNTPPRPDQDVPSA